MRSPRRDRATRAPAPLADRRRCGPRRTGSPASPPARRSCRQIRSSGSVQHAPLLALLGERETERVLQLEPGVVTDAGDERWHDQPDEGEGSGEEEVADPGDG